MDALRTAARESLLEGTSIPETLSIADSSLDQLWQHISAHTSPNHLSTCECLLVAQTYLNAWTASPLPAGEEEAVNHLYDWASSVALPSPGFAVEFDETSETEPETTKTLDESRLRSKLAVSVLALLNTLLPIQKAANSSDIVVALASFTAEQDPWNSPDSLISSTTTLQAYAQAARTETDGTTFWSSIQHILKERIRPLFTKTRNPAITSTGRKNFHPVPLARFDGSILDQEARPWKSSDVYATTVLGWIIAQYQPSDRTHLETHFPLLVPAILSLIDDSSISFKTRGCHLLAQLLHPIRESGSEILQHTNLVSVFEDAVTPCLLSLPSITPEADSLKLLGAAYPALLSLFQTAYQLNRTTKASHLTSSHRNEDETYITKTSKILRSNLITSFHHISSPNPATSSSGSIASFPYPHLSTFLTTWISILVTELRSHSTKYLQDLIPVLYTIHSNPFGTVYPPLLRAATAAMNAVILNGHPRIWRWRGEILGGVCACWLHVLEGERKKREESTDAKDLETEKMSTELVRLKRELQGNVFLLKHALQNPVSISVSVPDSSSVSGGVEGEIDADQEEARNCLQEELQKLVDAEPDLRDVLFAEVGPDDEDCFAGSLDTECVHFE